MSLRRTGAGKLVGVRMPAVTFLGHSTVRVELAGRTVLTDPLLTGGVGPLRRVVPPVDPATWAGVDLVLISHLHGDHLHLPSLRRLGTGTRVVVPRGAGPWLRGKGFTRVEELAPGETLVDGGLTVTGVPAHHSGHRWGPRSTHGPDAAAMGHLLTGDGRCVYVAGDTDVFPEMSSLGQIDLALLPVWGWGTSLGPGHLDPAGAALACAVLHPRFAVPVHWGTLAAVGTTTLPRVRPLMRRLLVDPPHEFAAAVATAGLDTTVLVTAPGAPVVWPPDAGMPTSRGPAPAEDPGKGAFRGPGAADTPRKGAFRGPGVADIPRKGAFWGPGAAGAGPGVGGTTA